MMTDRGKLVMLLHEGSGHCRKIECRNCEHFTTLAYCKDNIVADHLLANGVTFATDINVGSKLFGNSEQFKWISVEDRLPDLIPCSAGTAYSEAVIIWTSGRKALIGVFDGDDFLCAADYWEAEDEEITHWMPLPEPPVED